MQTLKGKEDLSLVYILIPNLYFSFDDTGSQVSKLWKNLFYLHFYVLRTGSLEKELPNYPDDNAHRLKATYNLLTPAARHADFDPISALNWFLLPATAELPSVIAFQLREPGIWIYSQLASFQPAFSLSMVACWAQ